MPARGSSDSHRPDERETLLRLTRTPELFAAIDSAGGSELQVQARLREEYPAELVRMALEVVDMRRAATGKFTRAARMWLTRQGLEQATPEVVAQHKARRFAAASGGDAVWDICCGVGGDAIALAEVRDVIAVDLDPAQACRTELNGKVYELGPRLATRVEDVCTLDLAGKLVHADPDQRARGARSRRLEQSVPPLDWMQGLTQTARGGAIKVSPASNFGGKFPDAEIELISLDGECKEATVWFGELRGESPWRATVLPVGATLAGHPLDVPTDVRAIGRYVYDPDPAIVRAGLVDLLTRETGLWRLDAAEEYLSSDAPVASPFVRAFEVLDILPNNVRAVRQAVRERGWGSVEIKCRHVKVDADAIRRRLPLEGSEPGVMLHARIDGKTRVILARRVG